MLARPNGGSEDVGVFAVVVPKLKFGDVQMQVLFADLMERPDNAAFQDRPEAFDSIRMNCAVDILVRPMVNNAVWIALLGKARISGPVIRAEQGNLMRNGFVDECGQGRSLHVLDNARDDIALTANYAHHDSLILVIAPAGALIPMAVAAVAAYARFIDLNNAAKLLHVLVKRSSDLVTHKPSRLVGAEAHVAEDLQGAHALLRNQHQVRDSEPIFERLIRIFKNCSGKMREAVARVSSWGTLRALPMPSARVQFINRWVAATRTNDAIRPTANDQVLYAIVLSLKERVELRGGHLVDWLRLFCAGHRGSPKFVGA